MNYKFLSILSLFTLFLLTTACGNKGGGGSGSGSGPDSNNYRIDKCEIKFLVTDSLEVVAKKSQRAKTDCNLSEDEVITLIEKGLN